MSPQSEALGSDHTAFCVDLMSLLVYVLPLFPFKAGPRESATFWGQPSMAKGKSAEENQVSSTSGSAGEHKDMLRLNPGWAWPKEVRLQGVWPKEVHLQGV